MIKNFFKKIKQKIESNRSSALPFYRFLVTCKDVAWVVRRTLKHTPEKIVINLNHHIKNIFLIFRKEVSLIF